MESNIEPSMANLFHDGYSVRDAATCVLLVADRPLEPILAATGAFDILRTM